MADTLNDRIERHEDECCGESDCRICNIKLAFCAVAKAAMVVNTPREVPFTDEEWWDAQTHACDKVSPRRVHDLKIQPCYFGRVLSGAKKAEIRRNDRNYQVGDVLRLREYTMGVSGIPGMYTGREVTAIVTDALFGPCYGIEDDYVMLSIELAAMRRPSEEEEC